MKRQKRFGYEVMGLVFLTWLGVGYWSLILDRMCIWAHGTNESYKSIYVAHNFNESLITPVSLSCLPVL